MAKLKHKYMAVVEKGETNYGVFAPDVPGCVSVGNTIEEAIRNFREALQMHLKGMFEDGLDALDFTIVTAQPVEVEVDAPTGVSKAS